MQLALPSHTPTDVSNGQSFWHSGLAVELYTQYGAALHCFVRFATEDAVTLFVHEFSHCCVPVLNLQYWLLSQLVLVVYLYEHRRVHTLFAYMQVGFCSQTALLPILLHLPTHDDRLLSQ